jgi:hypothetical protein
MIYLARSLSIAAAKTVDCSFIEAEHSTQVSSKNNSRKNTCIAKHFAIPPPVSQSFHLPFVEQSQVLVYYLLVKTLFLKAVKQLRCFFFVFVFCFRVMLFNSKIIRSPFDWLGFCSQI